MSRYLRDTTLTPLQLQFSISVDRTAVHYIRASAVETANARQVVVEKQTRFVAQLNPRSLSMSPIRNPWLRGQALQAELNSVLADAHGAELQQLYSQAQTSAANRHVFEALEEATGEQLPREAGQWWSWWQSYNEYNWPKPTYYAYQNEVRSTPYAIASSSCFLAGTLVQTQRGPAPIESIRPGDRVLAQDQDTGELAFKLVLRTTLRPSTRMVCLHAGGEQITTTLGHPFWVSGHGWKMAKELTSGERLHSLAGSVAIEKIEPVEANQVHNLVVEDFNTYFVGNQKLLVHDNEFRKPTRATIPGLIADPITAATR